MRIKTSTHPHPNPPLEGEGTKSVGILMRRRGTKSLGLLLKRWSIFIFLPLQGGD